MMTLAIFQRNLKGFETMEIKLLELIVFNLLQK